MRRMLWAKRCLAGHANVEQEHSETPPLESMCRFFSRLVGRPSQVTGKATDGLTLSASGVIGLAILLTRDKALRLLRL
jgi:hypothetical protein